MSRTRRRRLLAVAVVAGLAAVTAVLVVDRGVAPPRATAQDVEGAVLLVPGFGGATGTLEVLAQALREAGRTATVVPVPGDGTGDLADSVTALDAAAVLVGPGPVDVVGYSAGGVVARLWARDDGSKARRVVTLGAPHHGTTIAAFGAALAPTSCPAACRQLVPGSPLLDALNEGDETPEGPQWLSLWTTQDQVVTPPESARLEGAVNLALQDLCPGISVDHGRLPVDPTVTRLVISALSGPALGPPDPDAC